MAWRFKASKYKNATPIVPKPEACIRDVTVGSYQTYGNNIAASAAFLAFNWDHNGSSLAVLPIDDCGRKSKTMPLLHAHTDTVTDMAFSPFHDGLLATGSQDCLVKLWHIPENGLQESLSDPECVFSHKQRRVETVSFHPTADCLLSSTSFTTLTLWDVSAQKEIFSNSHHTEVIQSLSWKQDGSTLVTSCKDKKLRVYDPRAPIDSCIVQCTDSHQNIKDSRVVWLGNSTRILTTGFDATRLRQVYIRDLRNFSEPEKSLELDSSTGILMPLFDPDTNMLFLAGKGDTTIAYMEVLDREPFLVEGIRHSGEQTKGACLVPKRALAVMQGEVNRVLQLTSSAVIPIMYQVPRKSYRDFHADLFPDTYGCHAKMSAAQWLNGDNSPPPKLSLDPSKRGQDEVIQVHRGNLAQLAQELKSLTRTAEKNDINGSMDRNGSIENGNESVTPPKPLPRSSRNGSLSESGDDQPNPTPAPTPAPFPKPVARPRSTTTTSTGLAYKPRLGPKPFTPPKLNAFASGQGDSNENNSSNSSDFDKVFSVPSAPAANQSANSVTPTAPAAAAPAATAAAPVPVKCSNGNHAKSDEETASSPPSSPEKPQPSLTAQRRPSDEADRVDPLERSGLRNSIAERRRLYESRSLSIQDPKDHVTKAKTPSPTPLRRRVPQEDDSNKAAPQVQRALSHDPNPIAPAPTPKRTSTVFGRVSKFRHLKGSPGHKSTHIENIRNLSRQICGECDGFHANRERVAVPLSGPGGRIAVLELSRTGRLPDGVTPALVHGTNIVDFQWDPFDCSRLAVACDDGTIKLWLIAPGGLTEPTNTPNASLSGHSEKIYLIKFHPLAKDVLASASFDMTIRIWDLESCTERMCLSGHCDQIFSMAWSPCGNFIATTSKDTKIRMFEPRASTLPIREGRGPAGTRGARIVWALDGNYIVVLGFDKVSERQISVYRSVALNAAMSTVGLDVSPSILIPFYDEDSSTLFATGRGDSTIYAFEVSEEAPFLCPLSHHRASSLHQGLSFLPKIACDVANVEFAKALRLTNNAIEPLSFTVPRIKSDLFQDDIFPPTKVTWEPTMTGAEWFNGVKRLPRRVSLRPPGMDSLSESLNTAPAQTNNRSAQVTTPASTNRPVGRPAWAETESPKQQQQQMHLAVSRRIELNTKLDQDEMEGVDDREWDD